MHAELGEAVGQVRWAAAGSVGRLLALSRLPAHLSPACPRSFCPAHPACRQAYLKLRRQEGVSEMGDLVLGLATELMTGFDFGPTCVGPHVFAAPLPAAARPAWRWLRRQSHGCPRAPTRCSFTSPFDVANKTTELLMLRGGVSCSCSDEGAIERYEAQLAAERSS